MSQITKQSKTVILKQMSTQKIALKYPFDIKNIRPYQANSFSIYTSKKQTTYDVSLFGGVKYEAAKLLRDLKASIPDSEKYDHEIYAKYAVSKLPEGTTIVNTLVFKSSINHSKQKIYVNLELHHDPNHVVGAMLEAQPLRRTHRLRPEPSPSTEPDLLDIDYVSDTEPFIQLSVQPVMDKQ